MPKHKCTICNEEFEDKYFDIEQNKCILHCEKIAELIQKNKEKYIELKKIVFSEVDAKDLNQFKKDKIIFKQCKFQGKITCSGKSIIPILEFIDCEFESSILWEDIKIEKEISFSNSTFQDKFIANKCTFNNKVNLEGVVYKHVADFSESTFKDIISLKYTLYEGYTTFRDVIFEKELDLRDTIFYDKVNFINVRKNENDEILDVSNRETARIIKDSFEQQNNIIEANKFYALEMEEREKELDEDIKIGKNIFEWLVFKIHGLASNHSQDWTLALFWIINLTFFYSFLQETIKDFYTLSSFVKIIFSFISILVIGCMTVKMPENYEKRWLATIPTTFVCYIFYGYLIEKDWNLSEFSKNLNSFSIMRGDEPITFGTLLFKIIIAYLIYQLIISIRQNTRRK